MLGRKKRYFENLSFAMDVVAATTLMCLTYSLLARHGAFWEHFLRTVTGYRFTIQNVVHLRGQGWIFMVILLCLFAALRLADFYQVNLFAGPAEVIFQSFRRIAIGLGLAVIFCYFFPIIKVNRSLLFGFACYFFLYHISKELLLRRYLLKKHCLQNPLEALLVCPERRGKTSGRFLPQGARQYSDPCGCSIHRRRRRSGRADECAPRRIFLRAGQHVVPTAL